MARVHLNAHQAKQLQDIDDDLNSIKKEGQSVHAKAKVNKDMDKLQELLDDLSNSEDPDAVAAVTAGLQECLFSLKSAVGKSEDEPIDLEKVSDAESQIKQAMGGMEEEE